jgi:hypothetical protein
MRAALAIASGIVVAAGAAACRDTRMDPCQFLTLADARSVDGTVTNSVWAGRGARKADNEVCTFYTDDGSPRVMLFVWYENDDIDPKRLVTAGADTRATIVDVSRGDWTASASFDDAGMQLFAARSSDNTIGFRVRKPIRRGSAEFDNLVRLAQAVLRH